MRDSSVAVGNNTSSSYTAGSRASQSPAQAAGAALPSCGVDVQCSLLVCVYAEIYLLGESQEMFTGTRCMKVRGQPCESLLSFYLLSVFWESKAHCQVYTASTFTHQTIFFLMLRTEPQITPTECILCY